MKQNWFLPLNLDGGSPHNMFRLEPIAPHTFGLHLLSQITSFVDNSLCHSSGYLSGSMAIQEAFGCFSKFAGAVLLSFVSGCNSNNINNRLSGCSNVSNPRKCNANVKVKYLAFIGHDLSGSRPKEQSFMPVIFGKIWSFAVRHFGIEAEQLGSFPALSLAAALVPPLSNLSPVVFSVPMENAELESQRCMNQSPCVTEHRECSDLSFLNSKWRQHAVEARTGIEFPTVLDNILVGENSSSFTSEVLVGTGSKKVTILQLKSLNIYAFGFYVHPFDVCKKLGSKYASLSFSDPNKHQDFYKDLLREDINMTVKLVVSCNGIKISTVKDAFAKSLRARLAKMNPDPDYNCLTAFGSLFSKDIQLQKGTTIDFRRTVDGQLITEIGGNHIGAVHSTDLCRAFFDIYIGDPPVSEQTKEEIGKNVASIIRRC